MDLTKQFSDREYAAALQSWDWLDLRDKTPRFTSLFGDVFLEDGTGAWWFLDRLGGELRPIHPSSPRSEPAAAPILARPAG